MSRISSLIALLLAVALLLTGCWNRRELNDLSIVAGLGIDKRKDKYLLTVQVVDPGEVAARKGASGRSPVTTYSATGATMFEAVRKMTTVTSRKLYFSHLRIIVIGEELAKEGIAETIDLWSRDPETRTDFYLLVARGTKAQKVLEVLTPMEKIPANKLMASLEVSEKAWAPTVSIQLDELISDIVSEGKEPVLTGVSILGNQEEGTKMDNVQTPNPAVNLSYKGIAVFKEDKLVGWLNTEESKGYSDLTDKLDSTILEVACPEGGKLAVEIIRAKTKVKGKLRNGEPEVDVAIRSEANVGDVECRIDLMHMETIAYLEMKVEEAVKNHAGYALKKARKLKSDIFGFGEAIHRAAPKYWSTHKQNWTEIFQDLPVNMKVEVRIRRLGTIGDTFINKMKE
ncbi:Ger(x)C family spore germination protein [Paenibacillus sp. J5C_2022]|uniref:Ger(x)C family spore germination protein n=1 Tax=Paenibacillus sp. J5C2022 TaxID=2977129 RepID=UPI0021CFCDA6|nr:Ger(x)C family spore germination protein [Paenibacillus sp. J5C2022]MCU6710771.1 Ger(x)C family spore germination protein [Paenibacillus sp. J5C2022]